MCNAKPVKTPLETGIKLQSDEGKPMEDASRNRQLVGTLIYLTVTHPDIFFAVSLVIQFMQHPKAPHWNAILRMLRYLKSRPCEGLLYTKHKLVATLEIQGFVDAHWSGSIFDRRLCLDIA